MERKNQSFSRPAMTKPTILAFMPLLQEQMDRMDDHFNVVKLYKEPNPEEVLQAVKDEVKGIVAMMNNSVRENIISALPNLEIISLFSVGYDNVDMDAARARNITVTNAPDIVTADTADTALALLLAVSRRIVEMDAFVRVGRWQNAVRVPLGNSLTGKKAGIVGLGRIGQAIAKRLSGFDVDIAYYGRNKKAEFSYEYYDDLAAMAADVDYLVLSCPGGEATKHIINRDVLAALGNKGFLINVARGSVVDENALIEALHNNVIAGAALDVYENEPEVPQELKSMDNVVLLPHIGTATVETRGAMGDLVVDNLLAHFDGKPVLTPIT